jgi:hypothetical protein
MTKNVCMFHCPIPLVESIKKKPASNKTKHNTTK